MFILRLNQKLGIRDQKLGVSNQKSEIPFYGFYGVQKNPFQALLTPSKLRLRTKNISNGIKIVIIPRKYARYGDNIPFLYEI